jgi:uncharacterized protein
LKTILNNIAICVSEKLKSAEGGHDWFHISRVLNNASIIAESIPASNKDIITLAALLHDIGDAKFHNGNEDIGPTMAEKIMFEKGVPENILKEVILIIQNISFRDSYTSSEYHSIEFDIVQDADRLDAIGAIGIARAFNYGGFKNRKMYDPEILPVEYKDKESYQRSTAPTINHFYEKLFQLKDAMKTSKGREMAEERHQFMMDYLHRFFKESGIEPFNNQL